MMSGHIPDAAGLTDPGQRVIPLQPGTLLGPYQIVAPLGSGGMGAVYRARDPRLERDVAIKVLLARFSTDPEGLHRFEQEARTTGMLNHPNIVAIHDVGEADGTPYVITELLEGMTLRELLRQGPLPVRTTLEYGVQTALGLAAAHRKGIIHRDLKPENLFVTDEGQIKILDFGLAKLREPKLTAGPSERPTWVCETQEGTVLGTIGYMAPEQVRGEEADERSDIFALGAILYEMLTGRRAFERASPAETMSAILHQDPPDLSSQVSNVGPVLDRLVCRCLEKRADDRFQSAHDLAVALETLSGPLRTSGVTRADPLRSIRRPARATTAAALGLAVVAAAVYWRVVPLSLWRSDASASAIDTSAPRAPRSHRLTFQRGWISAARFAPDGHTVVYSASWDGRPAEIFLVRPENPESRPLNITDADLLGVSRSGELAILRDPRLTLNIYHRTGTLARVSLGGGVPRDLAESTRYADWGPDGSEIAVIRDVSSRRRLEYPVGNTLYDTPNASSNTIVAPRVSPAGGMVAFFEGFGARVARWSIAVVDRQGTKTILSRPWYDWWRLAWSGDGREVWFAASEAGSASALYAVNLAGQQRLVWRVPGTIELHDIRDSWVLLTLMTYRTFTRGLFGADRAERDLSWLDGSAAVALSRDGRMLVLDEHGEGGGATNATYVRKTDGSAAIRLGEGRALALSPDAGWVLTTLPGAPAQLYLLPTGAGETHRLDTGGLEFVRAGTWSPDGTLLLLAAAEPGRDLRVYVQHLDGPPRAITPEGFDINGDAIAPDGKRVVTTGPRGEVIVWPIDGGDPQIVPGADAGDIPIGWNADGRSLYVFRRGELPGRVFRLEIDSGRRHLWKTFTPPDPAGVGSISSVLVTPDGAAAVYSYEQALSELYLVEGLN